MEGDSRNIRGADEWNLAIFLSGVDLTLIFNGDPMRKFRETLYKAVDKYDTFPSGVERQGRNVPVNHAARSTV